MHRKRLSLLLLTVACAAAALPARAADDPPPAPRAASDPLGPARQQIAAQRWPAALDLLKTVNAAGNPDWNNLMGFALRKQATPDLDGAQRHYDEALRLDPRHKGALEYSGELALMKGDLPRAEQRLATLERVCGGGCEEATDLKAAIAQFKSSGRRPTAEAKRYRGT